MSVVGGLFDKVRELMTGEAEPEPLPPGSQRDALGSQLNKLYEAWKTARIDIETEWLKDLRIFNQIKEANAPELSTYHGDVYTGLARSRVYTAYARIVDPLFQGSDKHWALHATPVPEQIEATDIDPAMLDDPMAQAAARMERNMEDQLLEMHYEERVKAAILESCILGTGVVKGVVPGVKLTHRWVPGPVGWLLTQSEIPYPQLGEELSIFDVFPDPYALSIEDMTGIFERHVLNRAQMDALADDPRFDATAIKRLLIEQGKGHHQPLTTDIALRQMAGIADGGLNETHRFDVIEYWGQVSGALLSTAGIASDEPLQDGETYYANVWICGGTVLYAALTPMATQRLPYNFFPYQRVPHKFWGIGVVRMSRTGVAIQNAGVQAMCDNVAISALPMREVYTPMLRDGEDPRALLPGHVFIRDEGDPSVPAVRWYSPPSTLNQIVTAMDVGRRLIDEETNMPSYLQGQMIEGLNTTASGTSMLMGAANVQTKTVVRNLEDFLIRPLLTSLYHWNMLWHAEEASKGDYAIDVRGSTALIAKEIQSQRLTQFLQITAAPAVAPRVDIVYLLRELAQALEIDPKKAVPDLPQMANTALPMTPEGMPYGPDSGAAPPGADAAPGLPGLASVLGQSANAMPPGA